MTQVACGGGEAASGARDASAAADATRQDSGADGHEFSDAGEGGGSGARVELAEAGGDFARFRAVVLPGEVAAIDVDVPDDALSFAVTVSTDGPSWGATLRRLVSPSGEMLYEDDGRTPAWPSEDSPYRPTTRASLHAGMPFTFLVPNAPHLALEPGRYRADVTAGPLDPPGILRAAPDDIELQVDATFRMADRLPVRGAIDVVVWLAAPTVLDAETAPTDPTLTAALDTVRDTFAVAGLDVSVQEYRDLPDVGDGVVTGLAALAELYGRLHAGDALPLVIARAIELGPGRTVVGRASGVPGPPPHAQLARAGGVALSIEVMGDDPEWVGRVAAHEMAHYLGLAHTTEQDGAMHDPIEDTPECAAERASQRSTTGVPILSAEDCAGYGGDNLMFATPSLTTRQTKLTDGQSWVLLRNPAVR